MGICGCNLFKQINNYSFSRDLLDITSSEIQTSLTEHFFLYA